MKIQKYQTFSGFTLIELMVVITIISIIMMASYFPYAHHQKKVLLNQGVKEVAQSLSEVRNLALHGLDTGSGNLNTALLLRPGSSEVLYFVST